MLVTHLQKLIKKLTHAGVPDDLNFHDRRKILLLNTMSVVGITAYLLLCVINIARHSHPNFLISNLSGQAVLFITIFLNYKRKYRAAAMFCSIVFLIYVNASAILYGVEDGTEYINILLCVTPLILFDDKKTILVFSTLSIIGFFASRYSYTIFTPVFKHGNPLLFHINMAVLFISVFLLFLFFKNEIMKYAGIVEKQHDELAQKNADIKDSIKYARRIQNVLLRFDDEIIAALPHSFILYMPRDIVSGDFYWFAKNNGKIYGACADCTGHGVPGAFMCMIGMTLLNDIIKEKGELNAGEILNRLSDGVIRMMKQTGSVGENRDGMDISLMVHDSHNSTLEFAGANHSLLIIRKGEMMEFKGDKQPIGIHGAETKPFRTQTIPLEKNDTIYSFTDGYADQFGGPKGKKFKTSQLKKLILSVNHLPMEEQREKIKQTFIEWKGKLEQVDDVLVFGVRM